MGLECTHLKVPKESHLCSAFYVLQFHVCIYLVKDMLSAAAFTPLRTRMHHQVILTNSCTSRLSESPYYLRSRLSTGPRCFNIVRFLFRDDQQLRSDSSGATPKRLVGTSESISKSQLAAQMHDTFQSNEPGAILHYLDLVLQNIEEK